MYNCLGIQVLPNKENAIGENERNLCLHFLYIPSGMLTASAAQMKVIVEVYLRMMVILAITKYKISPVSHA